MFVALLLPRLHGETRCWRRRIAVSLLCCCFAVPTSCYRYRYRCSCSCSCVVEGPTNRIIEPRLRLVMDGQRERERERERARLACSPSAGTLPTDG